MYRYLPPDEAVPLLLDPAISPVVGIDTEFDSDDTGLPTCRAGLRGLSLAGGNPKDGIFGTFWHFGNEGETWPWEVLRERVLKPIVGDPSRALVAHPLKTELQILRARGVTSEHMRCELRCTMSQLHVWNENMPKSLKDAASALLGVTGTTTYTATRAELAGIVKEGEREVKAILKAAWEYYRDWRKTKKGGEPGKARIQKGTTGPYTGPRVGWHDLVDRLPTYGVSAAAVKDYIRERVEPVVMAEYERRARERFAIYGAEDAIFTLHLDYVLRDEIRPDDWALVDLETKVCHPVVTEMEERGMPVDLGLLTAIRTRMEEAAAQLHKQVVAEWGTANGIPDFNPGSDDQKAHVLWEVWRLRPPKWALERGSGGALKPAWARKKDGLCKTGKEVLAALISRGGEHAAKIQRMAELSRIDALLSNPVKPIEQAALMDPDHRLHYGFWPVGTETGRFASTPNAQNIPRTSSMPYYHIPKGADPASPPRGCVVVKREDGTIDTRRWQIASLRDVFAARPGWRIVSADLSQIENRIVAYEANDATLLGIYRNWDCADCGASGTTETAIHACPACGAPDGKRDKTRPDQPAVKGFCLGRDIHAHSSVAVGFYERWGYAQGRQAAKALNHAAAYGMGASTMARYYDMDRKVCQEALDSWHARHPGVRRMHERVAQCIREHGEVVLFSGHRRRFFCEKLLADSGNMETWAWEKVVREGVNSLAQGGVAAIMKQSMIDIRQAVMDTPHLRGNVWAVNQVHDETVYEVREEYAEEVLKLVCYHMEHNHLSERLPVPVIAEGATGMTWGEAH